MWTLDPDVARAVASWVAHFVGECRAVRFKTEVDGEVAVHCQPSAFRVDVDLKHEAPFPKNNVL